MVTAAEHRAALDAVRREERERLTETEDGWTSAVIWHAIHVYKMWGDEDLGDLLKQLAAKVERTTKEKP